MSSTDPFQKWRVKDALETYGVNLWGGSYFSINDKGHVIVRAGLGHVDLKQLVDDLIERGIGLPLLLRFDDLLQARIELLNNAFLTAIAEYGYAGRYQGVYPIKVNQSRKVVEEIVRFGKGFDYGLEAGSKPELLAVMAMLDNDDALIICNGYKDASYVETALLASKLGRTVIIVIEKPAELEVVRRAAQATGIEPMLGLRMRLTTRGSGKWEQSGGDRSKFGLSAGSILEAVEQLGQWEMLKCFKLLHFHIGSQISSIRSIKDALREAGQMFTQLVGLGCTGLSFLDVGGGLGVDYDGSQTSFDSSMNYTVQEYANDVVSAIQDACDVAGCTHPTIVSESGRAVVAHHSVLVVNVLGATDPLPPGQPAAPEEDDPDVLYNLWEVLQTVSRKNLRECYHDAIEYRDQVLQLFNLGHLTLPTRVRCERIFWAACHRMHDIARGLSRIPEELESLGPILSDIYFCNFSMFQSLPDAWAVDQLFPIMPIHRLDERPTRQAVLADVTCDSDGQIDSFIDPRDVKPTLSLHALNDQPYYLAVMLTGAYQEILGDLHNLFGDTNVVHIGITGEDDYEVTEVIAGDTVTEVLEYVDYQPQVLLQRVRAHAELAIRRGVMTAEDARQLIDRYRAGLAASTYLE